MWYRQHTPWIGLAGAALLLVIAVRPMLSDAPRRPGPRTVHEAVAVAEALGLYHATDDAGGVLVHHLVVSELPLTRERAGCLRINDPSHPCWAGTVSIYSPWQMMMPNYDPACSAVWGELFIYGDPALVRKLTGRCR